MYRTSPSLNLIIICAYIELGTTSTTACLTDVAKIGGGKLIFFKRYLADIYLDMNFWKPQDPRLCGLCGIQVFPYSAIFVFIFFFEKSSQYFLINIIARNLVSGQEDI